MLKLIKEANTAGREAEWWRVWGLREIGSEGTVVMMGPLVGYGYLAEELTPGLFSGINLASLTLQDSAR